MIEIKYEGRHGNFIFQYIFAQYISFLTGQEIKDENNYYKHTNNRFIIFNNKEESINLNGNNGNNGNNGDFLISDKNAEDIIQRLIQNKDLLNDKNIALGNRTGYYQNSTLYKHHVNFIPSIIKYPQPASDIYDDKSVVIHLRLDDFHRNGNDSEIICFNYYDKILKTFQYTDVHIVYNKPENSSYKKRMLQKFGTTYSKEESEYLKYFQTKYNAKMITSNTLSDFKYFQKFKNVILSASSFGFWATGNISHKCIIHIPTHNRCNATCNTGDILKWCGHHVIEYPDIEFINFNKK